MQPRHAEQKEQQERVVFAGFAKICPLSIVPGSIQNRKPPQPDIRCSLANGVELAFELTEILDQSLAARRGGIENASEEFDHLVAVLPEDSFVKQRYRDAVFRVILDDGSLGSRRSVVALLEHLGDPRALLRIGKNEFVRLPADPKLRPIRSVSMERGRRDGPHFVVQVGGGFMNPAERTISDKFARSYNTDVPIELLVYLDRQPQTGHDAWLHSLAKFLEESVGKSQFQRVWVYDHRHERILLVYEKRAATDEWSS